MKKTIALVVTLVLVGAFALSATMAYLTGETAPISNVFVVGDITISLAEEKWKPSEESGLKGKIIPGETIAKDPTVTVAKGSEECYLYMYLENTLAVSPAPNTWSYVNPNINNIKEQPEMQWVPVGIPVVNPTTGAKKELYRFNEVVNAKDADKKLTFFSEVNVPGNTFTKESMASIGSGKQAMTVEAFAYQKQNVEQKDADLAAIAKYLTAY